MARPLILEFAGALYHITSRGNRQDDIYENDADRQLFLSILGQVCETYNWSSLAYCLMSNHYHLLIETPDSNLSRGMRQLNGIYTQTFNRDHGRVGHVFQGRYMSILVEKENYLLELSRYIVLNPVRAGMVRSVKDWLWSSYRVTVGQSNSPEFLHTDWLLAAFANRKSTAIERYKAFVSAGKGQPSPWTYLLNQIYLGTEQFVEKMKLLVDGEQELSEVPSSQRRPNPKALTEYDVSSQDRNTAIYRAYQSGGYTLKEIGDYFDLHYTSMSGIVKGHKSLDPKDGHFLAKTLFRATC